MENTASGVDVSPAFYAKALYAAYIAFKRRFDPDEPDYRGGMALYNACEKAGVVCKAMNAKPKEYIAAQFEGYGPKVFPNQLYGAKAKENYRKTVEAYRDILPRLYQVQMEYLWDQLHLKRPLKDILMDDKIYFTPWFRIVITKEPIPEVMEKYMVAAKNVFTNSLKDFLNKKNLNADRIQ